MIDTLIIGILVVFGVLIAFKIIRSIIKAIMVGFLILVVLSGAVFFIGYMDYKQFSSKTLYIVVEDNNTTLGRFRADKINLNMLSPVETTDDGNVMTIRYTLLEKGVSDKIGNIPKEEILTGVRQGSATSTSAAIISTLKNMDKDELTKEIKAGAITMHPKPMSIKIVDYILRLT